jgi:hypothetical protein
MTRQIFRYPINLEMMGAQYAIPLGSLFLDLQVQDGVPVMWWSVPMDGNPPGDWPLRSFQVCPTGPPGYADNMHYVGTFQIGSFVGHVMSWEPIPR